MASKSSFSLFTIITLLLLIRLSLLSYATSSSPFEFLEPLEGSHKGDKVKGIQDLKKYLEIFGYLSKNGHSNNDHFDDQLESAIKTYQLNYHLEATGTLDAKTLSTMAMPRCGVADIVNDTTSKISGKKMYSRSHLQGHIVAHYAFFQGSPKWPPEKYHLTYAFAEDTPKWPSDALNAVARAFQTWADSTQFTFNEVSSVEFADIKIQFARGDHGDGSPFDGPGGVVAHSFQPPDGRLHFDSDDTWGVGEVPGAYDYESVALHEIGHQLGLAHSSVEEAIMWPISQPGTTKTLHADDIQGIKALYNT